MIPVAGRKQIIEQPHQSHPGITRMKGLVQSFVWWPGMDLELENKVVKCNKIIQREHLSILGNGLNDHGPRYMLIMPDLSWE